MKDKKNLEHFTDKPFHSITVFFIFSKYQFDIILGMILNLQKYVIIYP